MTQAPVWRWLTLATAGIVAAGTMTVVAVADEPKVALSTIQACASKRTGQLRLAKPVCKATEKKVAWAARGPRGAMGATGATGATGPAGPPGALASTPVNVSYAATSADSHDLPALGGMEISLECGTNRIGSSQVDVVLFGADEVHGTTTRTLYNESSTVNSTSAPLDVTNSPAAPQSTTANGGTHGTLQAQWVVSEAGVVYTFAMYATRDTRQNRPVCQFVGSLTQQGPPTVTPS
ncbi:hypothetical protein [Nocardioides rubriscoriae]|uniref:hypothetical protein n=1 Tax=Nocardioides rubriscoriae TaxID=642762 RepID=UPI0011E04F37|nr:hypothetical protein [Nocardioides rubriscoriae]